MLKTYLRNIAETAGMGDAREESYYSALSEKWLKDRRGRQLTLGYQALLPGGEGNCRDTRSAGKDRRALSGNRRTI